MPEANLTPRAGRLPILISWITILVLIGMIVYGNARRPGTDDAQMRSLANRLRGQFILSIKPYRAQADQLLKQMETDARSPEDRLHVAITIGEIEGNDRALDKLRAVADTPLPDLAEDIEALRRIYTSGAGALEPDRQERLVARHDYFGQLALAYGTDADVEPRKSLEQSARRFSMRLIVATLGLALIAGLSLILLVTAAVLMKDGKIRPAYQPDASAGSAFIESFALYLAIFFLALGPARRYVGLTGLGWEWLGILILTAVIAWTSRRGISAAQRQQAFGWHRGKGWMTEIAAGIGGYIAGLPFLVAGIFLTFLIVRWTGVQAGHPVVRLLGGDVWSLILLYMTVSIYAPLMEETMFRGALLHHLRRRWSWLAAATMASLIFAIVHPQGWAAVPALGANAMILSALREWRGSLIAPMAAHALNNFLAITLALLLLR